MAYVYRFKDKRTQKIIYVGKTKRSIESRMNEHFGGKGHLPDKCYKSVGRVEYIPMKTEADALFVENYFINKYKPIYNTKDKVDSELTYKLNIPEDWKLLYVVNDEKSRYNFPSLFEIAFWGAFLYFLILTIIGIYF